MFLRVVGRELNGLSVQLPVKVDLCGGGYLNAVKLTSRPDLAPSKSPPVGETLASLALIFLSRPYRGG
jgi:hypothetical protein